MLATFRQYLSSTLDFCYPTICAHCQTAYDRALPLCPDCMERLTQMTDAPFCDRCALPLPYPAAPCHQCRGRGLRPINRIVAFAPFIEPVRSAIHQMKYHRRWPLAETFADLMGVEARIQSLLGESDVVVPVPLHRLRQIRRGYNQADVLAQRLARQQGVAVAHPAARIRHTETQTHQHSRRQRLRNLRRAFALMSPAAIRGKRVLLVDDVLTTGATLQSLARALLPGQPASINALVLAVVDPRRDFDPAAAPELDV